ncbi:hypothetical protein L828_1530 [Mycobacteroides abscessus MAB_030201_1061]|nr:hypothetical protein L828_1530 [Mycobacteroides abscessus MAB_030201_1061]
MADGRGWFPGQGGWQENEGPEDLAALRRTNRMIDAIAADLPVATSDSDEYAVAMMLAAWREDVGREPMPAKPTLGKRVTHCAIAAAGHGCWPQQSARRPR